MADTRCLENPKVSNDVICYINITGKCHFVWFCVTMASESEASALAFTLDTASLTVCLFEVYMPTSTQPHAGVPMSACAYLWVASWHHWAGVCLLSSPCVLVNRIHSYLPMIPQSPLVSSYPPLSQHQSLDLTGMICLLVVSINACRSLIHKVLLLRMVLRMWELNLTTVSAFRGGTVRLDLSDTARRTEFSRSIET